MSVFNEEIYWEWVGDGKSVIVLDDSTSNNKAVEDEEWYGVLEIPGTYTWLLQPNDQSVNRVLRDNIRTA